MRTIPALLLPLCLVAQDPEAWKPRPDGSRLSLIPPSPRVPGGTALAFQVRREGPDASPLTWSATGGRFLPDGRWEAPALPGRYVVGVQGTDPSLSARATVEVTWSAPAAPVAGLRPARLVLFPGQAFDLHLEAHGVAPAEAQWEALGCRVDPKGRVMADQPGIGRVRVSWPGGPAAETEVQVVMPAAFGSRKVIAYLLLRDLASGALKGRDLGALTHACLSFLPMKGGEIRLPDAQDPAFRALPALRKRNPRLRILASVGGWGATGFSELAETHEGRRRFAASAVRLMEARGLDGLDLDWEYPCYAPHGGRPIDRETYVALLTDIRHAFAEASIRLGRPLLLTAAVPAGPDQASFYDWPRVFPLLDLVHLMTYDYHGPYEPFTAFHAPLRSVREEGRGLTSLSLEGTVQAFVDRGAPREKLILGLPFYGKAYRASGPGAGGPAQGAANAFLAFRHLPALLRSGTWVRERHPEAAQVTYWQPESRTWMHLDDAESIRLKAAFLLQQGLGGAMFWDLGLDDGTLLKVLAEALPPARAQLP